MRRCALISYLTIVAAVLLAYFPALHNGFVWDDTALVLRDPLIRSPLLLGEGLRHFLFLDATASDFFRPLQRAVYTLDYAAGGFTPWVYHFTSILVHAAAALALFEFGRLLLARGNQRTDPDAACSPQTALAFAAALLWAIHPIHTSAVVYVAGLADPLAALLGFGGLALLLANRRVAAGFCLGGALFAKESGVFALLVGLGFAWQMAAEMEFQPTDEIASKTGNARPQSRWTAFARVALPALLMAVLYFGLRTTAERTPPPAPEPVPVVVRPILALRAVAEYAGLLVAPINLRMERDVSTRTGGTMGPTLAAAGLREFQTLIGAVLLCGMAIWFRRSTLGATRACLLAALAAYLPVSNLFALNATVAEHWMYVPSAFLFLAVAAFVGGRLNLAGGGVRDSKDLKDEKWKSFTGNPLAVAALSLFAVWLVALGFRTVVRCADFRTPEAFFQATIRDGGDTERMFINLAGLELKQGDIRGAIRDFHEALARKPNQPLAMLGLAGALIRQHSWTEARWWVRRCEAVPLIRAEALIDHAVVDFQESGVDRADLLREAALINPRFWPTRKRYISHLIERGDTEQALRELRAVVGEQPYRAETWAMLGTLLEKTGSQVLAGRMFQEAHLRDIHLADH